MRRQLRSPPVRGSGDRRRGRGGADRVIGRAVRDGAPHFGHMKGPILRTERLVLRRWTDGDRAGLARITADPEVMRYRLRTLSRRESDDFIDATETCFEQKGFGMWAAERADDGRLVGYIGHEEASDDMP